jgi:hypothetical protein
MVDKSDSLAPQVFVECSSLSPILRDDLQAFLERLPEVRFVTRKLHVTEALINPDTHGLVAPRFDLVVHLVERPRTSTVETTDGRAALVLKKVAEWTQANRPRGPQSLQG